MRTQIALPGRAPSDDSVDSHTPSAARSRSTARAADGSRHVVHSARPQRLGNPRSVLPGTHADIRHVYSPQDTQRHYIARLMSNGDIRSFVRSGSRSPTDPSPDSTSNPTATSDQRPFGSVGGQPRNGYARLTDSVPSTSLRQGAAFLGLPQASRSSRIHFPSPKAGPCSRDRLIFSRFHRSCSGRRHHSQRRRQFVIRRST